MAPGVLSIALSLDEYETLSRILLAITAAAWLALGLVLGGRAVLDRGRVHREARSPAALTGVAATAVLGTRLTLLGWSSVAIALLAIAVLLWLVLLAPVLSHLVTPAVGLSLVPTVSTESLAVFAATLALHERTHWLLEAAFAPFLLGLVFYAFVAARFDIRQLVLGAGDQWVMGGALAISTLAAARITLAANGLGGFLVGVPTLEDISLVLWGLAIVWLPPLLAFEVLRPRLRYDPRRWSTAFVVAMYAACSFAVGAATQASTITDFARVWVWVASALSLILCVAVVRRGLHIARGRALNSRLAK